MRSEDSQIFKGVNGRFDRNVAVYIPAGYVPGTPTPFMVVQDGVRSYMGRIIPVLDNLISQRRIPSMVAVFVDPGPSDGPGSDRGYEYDHLSDRYVNFIETEVLPKITRDYNVRFTADREGRATFGASSGAAAALTMAWFRPNLYSKVLSYSGTFVNQQRLPDSPYPRGAWEYHQTLIPSNPAKPIRMWLHISDRDNGNSLPEEVAGQSWRNWVLANMHMLDAVKSKGYDYR
jgi:enterochelin esterase-like enzyme